jgi:hypothetical protein
LTVPVKDYQYCDRVQDNDEQDCLKE